MVYLKYTWIKQEQDALKKRSENKKEFLFSLLTLITYIQGPIKYKPI